MNGRTQDRRVDQQRRYLLHLRARRVLLARRINTIALKMVDLRTELETLDEEMKTKAPQLAEVDRGIRALRPGVPPAQPARRNAQWEWEDAMLADEEAER
jgi:hypothetical protein